MVQNALDDGIGSLLVQSFPSPDAGGGADKDIENRRDRNVIQGCGEPEKKAYQKLLLKDGFMERDLTPHLAVSLNDSLLVFKDRNFLYEKSGTS